MTVNDIVNDIRHRNALRKGAELPILDEEVEIARRLAAERAQTFDEAFAQHRLEYADIWSNRNESWLSRAARWSSARADFRMSFDHRESNGTRGA